MGNVLKWNIATSSTSDRIKFWGIVLLQLILGGIFIYSSLSKLSNIFLFGQVLSSYNLLPTALIKPGAIFVPMFEILVGLGMLFTPTMKAATYGIMLASLVFAVVLFLKWGQVMPYGCGCFGPSAAHTIGVLDVGKDLLLVVVGAVLIWMKDTIRMEDEV